MKVAIHQPEHLPWLGFFNKMSMADIYVIFDDVQFEKNNFQNRNRIMGTNGPQWLGIPVNLSGHATDKINEITIAREANPKWATKYLNTIRFSYCKHPYFQEYFPFFEDLFAKDYKYLIEVNEKIIFYFADLLKIQPKFVKSSEISKEGSKSDLVLFICKYLNADTYISGTGARGYLHEDAFNKVGINVVYQNFNHPVYGQYNRDNFTWYLSTLDLLFNVGAKKARELIV